MLTIPQTELRLRMIQATNAGMTETEITKLAEEVYAIHGRGPATGKFMLDPPSITISVPTTTFRHASQH
jgi:hypothetical protein